MQLRVKSKISPEHNKYWHELVSIYPTFFITKRNGIYYLSGEALTSWRKIYTPDSDHLLRVEPGLDFDWQDPREIVRERLNTLRK
jgi:hypothetical protein